MEATIKFTLPDEQVEFECAASGWKLAGILFDLDNRLRNLRKYEGQETITIEDMRTLIRETMQDQGIYFEMLMFS
jgi:hypothetical protein